MISPTTRRGLSGTGSGLVRAEERLGIGLGDYLPLADFDTLLVGVIVDQQIDPSCGFPLGRHELYLGAMPSFIGQRHRLLQPAVDVNIETCRVCRGCRESTDGNSEAAAP